MPANQTPAVNGGCVTHRHKQWRTAAIVLAVVVVVLQWVRIGIKPRGDFLLHWELGRRLVAGEFLYAGGHDLPYPPFWGLVHAPLTVVPMHVAQVLTFPLFLAALWLLLWVLERLTRRHLPLDRELTFWAMAAAVALSSRFIVRDMTECGVNLALVAVSWLAVYLWTRRREWWGGVCLGLAISLKCTPAAFLGYFVWKRQWKMALATTIAAALFSLSPTLWMGRTEFARAGHNWVRHARKGLTGSDPSRGVLGPERLQNISLRPALARYLIHLPEDHVARLNHAFYFDVFDLPPVAAGWVIKGVMLALALSVAWKFRRVPQQRDDITVVWECAAISLAVLLYSPITWGQHCVGVLPAFYLLSRKWFAERRLPKWNSAVVLLYAFAVLGLNRTFVGLEISWLLDSYHVHTWCLLLLLGVTVSHQSLCHAKPAAVKQTERGLLRRAA